MARTSRISTVNKSGDMPPAKNLTSYVCTRCGKRFNRQRGNFTKSNSVINLGINGYLPVCNACVDELFNFYADVLGSEREAMRRLCMKLDIYWNDELFVMSASSKVGSSLVRSYISRMNLVKYSGKTYDDTINEEMVAPPLPMPNVEPPPKENDGDDSKESKEAFDPNAPVVRKIVPPDDDVVEFWGAGFTPDFYADLESRYARFTENKELPLEVEEEAIYRQLSILDVRISRSATTGEPVAPLVNMFNTLMGSLNAKPVQKKKDAEAEKAASTPFDSLPFGVGIKMFEYNEPIPKPDSRFEDVDGVIKYVTVWFLGHLCKMLGIRNTYCKMYEKEMDRLRVKKPEVVEDDEEDAFNDIFSDES